MWSLSIQQSIKISFYRFRSPLKVCTRKKFILYDSFCKDLFDSWILIWHQPSHDAHSKVNFNRFSFLNRLKFILFDSFYNFLFADSAIKRNILTCATLKKADLTQVTWARWYNSSWFTVTVYFKLLLKKKYVQPFELVVKLKLLMQNQKMHFAKISSTVDWL